MEKLIFKADENICCYCLLAWLGYLLRGNSIYFLINFHRPVIMLVQHEMGQ